MYVYIYIYIYINLYYIYIYNILIFNILYIYIDPVKPECKPLGLYFLKSLFGRLIFRMKVYIFAGRGVGVNNYDYNYDKS